MRIQTFPLGVIFFVLSSCAALYGQRGEKKSYDRIFLITGETVVCRILSEDSLSVHYAIKEKGINVTSAVARTKIDHIIRGVYGDGGSDEPEDSFAEKFSLGIGLGFDYGGIGGNATLYANRNLGFFVGFGYALAGAGVNAGTKIRLMSSGSKSRVIPFFTGMYGYTTAIAVPGDRQWDKIFYGPSFGFGLDVHQKRPKNGLWCFALMVPVRGDKPDEYLDMLQSTQGIVFENDSFLPVAISIGYRFKFE